MYRSIISLVALLVFGLPLTAEAGTIIADYRDDFQGPAPAMGWLYQTNDSGAIGNSANYTDLIFTGSVYDNDGVAGFPGPGNGGFVNLTPTSGHPGLGTTQAASGGIDRFVIAGYQVQTASEAGNLAISGSFLQRGSTLTGPIRTGIDLQVYVNNTLVQETTYPISATPHGFNTLLGNVNVGDTVFVAVGPDTQPGNDGFALDFSVEKIGDIETDVASYRGDFQAGGFPTGWSYQWNENGAIGDSSNYSDMEVAGVRYESEAPNGLPDAEPGAFVNLDANGGHPGRGAGDIGNANLLDRYAIAEFTITEDGDYGITDGFVDPVNGNGNGGDLFVHVNDDPVLLHMFFDDARIDFNTFLGSLSVGDRVYVGVGPNTFDGNDSFQWDFTVTRFTLVPEPTTAMLALLGSAGLLRRRRQVA